MVSCVVAARLSCAYFIASAPHLDRCVCALCNRLVHRETGHRRQPGLILRELSNAYTCKGKAEMNITQLTAGNRLGHWLAIFSLASLPVTILNAAINFEDASSTAGLTFSGESFGASWADVNMDGYPDLFASHHRSMTSLYMNNGNGTFTDRGSAVSTWAAAPERDTHGGGWGDFDGDGDPDLMVGTGRGNLNQFFVNEGGQLQDQTQAYNLEYSTWAGRLSVWFDYNLDGRLDFLMGQFNGPSPVIKQTSTGFTDVTATTGVDCTRTSYGQLYDFNNDGRMEIICARDGTYPNRIYDTRTTPFTDITASMPPVSAVVDAVIGDFNGDLRQDFFLPRGLVRVDDAVVSGNRTLEAALVGDAKGFSFVSSGSITVDIDWQQTQDGLNYDKIKIGSTGVAPANIPFTLNPASGNVSGLKTHNPADAPAIYVGYNPSNSRWTVMHHNDGQFSNAYVQISSTSAVSGLQTIGYSSTDGPLKPTLYTRTATGFNNTTNAAGLAEPISCISGVAADFDNDMDMDLYLACRSGAQNLPNRLYENRGNGVFDLRTLAGGAQGPVGAAVTSGAGTADSVVVADYDVDGYPDIYVSNGLNMRPIYLGGPEKLYHNLGSGNHWIQLDLVGTASNPDAVGARIIATAGGVSQLREQNGGYHRWSQNHQRIHFGLASHNTVDLRVEWPNGAVDELTGVTADRLYRLTEGGVLQDITPGSVPPPPPPSGCGAPGYDPASDRAVLLWKSCDDGSWHVRYTASGGYVKYTGSVTSPQGFTNVAPFSVEGTDTFNYTPGSSTIDYIFKVSPPYQDGFSFSVSNDSGVCFDVATPGNATVLYGPGRTPVSVPMDLATQGACAGTSQPVVSVGDVQLDEGQGPASFTVMLSASTSDTVTMDFATQDGSALQGLDYTAMNGNISFTAGQTQQTILVPLIDDTEVESTETFGLVLSNIVNAIAGDLSATASINDNDGTITPDCGSPNYNQNTEKSIFLWKECNDEVWKVRFTSGSSYTRYVGQVSSNQNFSSVIPISIESSDTLDNTNAATIDYDLKVGSTYTDGFNFRFPSGAAVCFGVDLPAGSIVEVGAGRMPISAPFSLQTLGPC